MRVNNNTASVVEFGLLLLLGFLWGIPYALTKIAVETIPPITLTAARLTVAAAVLWLVAAFWRRSLPLRWDLVRQLLIQGCVACSIPYTLIAFGQQSVHSALAATMNSSTPLFVCLISVMWTHHERMTFGRLLGVIVGLGGVVAIAGGGALLHAGQETVGQLAIIAATFSSAVSVVYGRRFTDVAPEAVAAGMLTCAAVVLVPVSLVTETPWQTVPSTRSLMALSANAIVATAFGFVIYFRLIRTIGSMGTASTGYLKPGVGVIVGCTLLGEPMTWSLGFGLVAILLGVVAINQDGLVTLLFDPMKRFGRRLQQRTAACAQRYKARLIT